MRRNPVADAVSEAALEVFLTHFRDPKADIDLRIGTQKLALRVETGPNPAQAETVVEWTVGGPLDCHLQVSPALTNGSRIVFVASRLRGLWPVLRAFHASGAPERGRININLEDHTVRPGLSFCANDARGFLVPDPRFLSTNAYADTRRYLANGGPAWQRRLPAAVWRGATTGMGKRDWHLLPRIHLCELSLTQPDLLDAGITSVVQFPPEVGGEIAQAGLMRPAVPAHDFAKWRYQIDIDGNSSSWPGLFQKLLTGSPVIKVASPQGWRQWYYDKLVPWVNFVPASSSMQDLMNLIRWLRSHDSRAREIGQAGRALALSLTFEDEVRRAVPVVQEAFRAAAAQT